MKLSTILKMNKVELKPCEYLEGDGTDYIQTDIIPTTEFYRTEYKISLVSTEGMNGGWCAFFGVRDSSSYCYAVHYYKGVGKFYKGFGTPLLISEEYTVGDVVEKNDLMSGNTLPPHRIILFGMNDVSTGDNPYYFSNSRIYYIKIYNKDNELIHDLKPYSYGSKGCIKDEVTDKIYFSKKGLVKPYNLL